jgi:laccase
VGALWWHAHSSWLRVTVYGAIIIHPKDGGSYPFSQPYADALIQLGEWWKRNPIDVINQAIRTGGAPNISNAYTINGEPRDLYPCSRPNTFRLVVTYGQIICPLCSKMQLCILISYLPGPSREGVSPVLL